MRVLLSTIGSRGDFQPLLALGVRLRELGREVRLCAPPDFSALADDHGLPFVPVGPPLRSGAGGSVSDMVAGQFAVLREAARDCEVIVGCNQLQVAAASVAELLGIRYVFADYSPVALPSPHQAPPPMPGADGLSWEQEIDRRNALWAGPLNEQRVAAGLDPIADVHSHIVTERPVLAADPALAPWPGTGVIQTGAWILPDRRPLPADVEEFLSAGEPPVYFGFGSMWSPRTTGPAVVEMARALGYRAIVSRGWGELAPVEGLDCLAVAEVNVLALFPRVAAVVHHGGAGTTTAAARAGVPQVVVPHQYDQGYFAQRVHDLGIGVAHPGEPTTDSLTASLKQALQPDVVVRAWSFGPQVRTDGTTVAAKLL
jgi:vancomycin aglycone glucosyltransferase